MCHFCPFVVVVLLVTASIPARAADVDRYVPADAQLVAHVNLRQSLDAPLTRKYALEELQAALQKHAAVRQALDALGIDPFHDLDAITVAGSPADGRFQGLAIVRGRFHPAKVRTTAEQFARDHPDELKIQSRDGVVVYEAVSRGPKGQSVFAALLGRDVLVLSPSREAVRQAVARRDERKSAALARDLQALLDDLDGKQSAWVAGVVTEAMQKELARSLLGKQRAGEVKSFSGGVRVDDAIRVDFRIQTKSAHTASELRKMLDGLKALAAFAVANNKKIPAYGPLLSDLIHAVKIGSDRQGMVTLRADITPAQIDRGLREGQKHGAPGA